MCCVPLEIHITHSLLRGKRFFVQERGSEEDQNRPHGLFSAPAHDSLSRSHFCLYFFYLFLFLSALLFCGGGGEKGRMASGSVSRCDMSMYKAAGGCLYLARVQMRRRRRIFFIALMHN